MLEKILEEIIEQLKEEGCIVDNDAGNRAEEIILQRMNDGWIPVEERMPVKHESVLMCDAAGYREVGWWTGKRWRTGFSRDIVAWQPLPEPYRPEKGRE